LRNTNTPGPPDVTVTFGETGDLPLAGDWDGNGSATVGVWRPADGTFRLRNANSAGPPDAVFAFGAAGDRPVAGNWDGK
jgi:hypothetical protein